MREITTKEAIQISRDIMEKAEKRRYASAMKEAGGYRATVVFAIAWCPEMCQLGNVTQHSVDERGIMIPYNRIDTEDSEEALERAKQQLIEYVEEWAKNVKQVHQFPPKLEK